MSLVNEMLQDLQHRKAANSKPLTGLRAVPAANNPTAPEGRDRRWLLVIAIIGVVVTIGWRMGTDTGSRAIPVQTETTQLPGRVNPIEPVEFDSNETDTRKDWPLMASLETNRLDFTLRSRPEQMTARSVPGKADFPVKTAAKTVALTPANKITVMALSVATDSADEANASAVIKPVDATVRLRREGLAALQAGRAAVAQQQFERWLQIEPGSDEIYLFLHAALQTQSKNAAARAMLVDGLLYANEKAQLAQVLANELLVDGEIEDALAVLTAHRPTKLYNSDYEARLAAVHQRAGQHTVAIELYEQLVARRPDYAAWWVALAISQEAQGNTTAAAKSFVTATTSGTLDSALTRYANDRLRKMEAGS